MPVTETMPAGHQPREGSPAGRAVGTRAAQAGSNAAVAQLFTRLAQEIEESKPSNCIHFVVDFLCRHYPEHLHGFASIWQSDPDLEGERHEVVGFFKCHKISTAVAAHFTNAGFDTLDTLTTLSPDNLCDIEAFNNVKWLPGHKVRLQQIFSEISARVRAYKQQVASQSYLAQPLVVAAAPMAAPVAHVMSVPKAAPLALPAAFPAQAHYAGRPSVAPAPGPSTAPWTFAPSTASAFAAQGGPGMPAAQKDQRFRFEVDGRAAPGGGFRAPQLQMGPPIGGG